MESTDELERQKRYSRKLEDELKAHKRTIENQALALDKTSQGDLFQKMQDEIEGKDIHILILEEEKMMIESKLDAKREKLKTLHKKLMKMKDTFVKVRKVVPKLQAENGRLRVEMRNLKASAEFEVASIRETMEDEQLYAKEDLKSELKGEWKKLKQENKALKKQLKMLHREDVKRKESMKQIRSKLILVKEKMDKVDSEKEEVQKKILNLKNENEKLKADIVELKKTHEKQIEELHGIYEEQVGEESKEKIKKMEEKIEYLEIEVYNQGVKIGEHEANRWFDKKLITQLESDLDASRDKSRRYFMRIQTLIDEQNAKKDECLW